MRLAQLNVCRAVRKGIRLEQLAQSGREIHRCDGMFDNGEHAFSACLGLGCRHASLATACFDGDAATRVAAGQGVIGNAQSTWDTHAAPDSSSCAEPLMTNREARRLPDALPIV